MTFPIKTVWAIGAPFLISVGTCYLFGYWGALEINVLEFIGFTDIAKLALYPLLASAIFFLVGAMWHELDRGDRLPAGGGAETRLGRFGRRHWRGLLSLNTGAIVLIAIFGPEPRKWFIVIFMLIPYGTTLSNVEWIIDVIPSPRMRGTLLHMLITLPAFAFASGRYDAYSAVAQWSAPTVEVERSGLPLISDISAPVLYLGLLGETYVLRETKTGKTALVKRSDSAPLFLSTKSGR
jgi:hypothetical protein